MADSLENLFQQITVFLHRIEVRLVHWNQFLPDGRDTLERELRRELYNNLERAFLYQVPILVYVLLIELCYSTTYSTEKLTVMDWYCTVLAHVTVFVTLFTIGLFCCGIKKYAYIIHVPNSIVFTFLCIGLSISNMCFQASGISLRGEHAPQIYSYVFLSLDVYAYFLMLLKFTIHYCLILSYENYEIYLELKRHQQVLDTIPQHPNKIKGA